MTEPTAAPVKHPKGLNYRGDFGTYSVYDFWLRGRVVLEVLVDNEDEELKIWIAKPGGVEAGEMLVTRGTARWDELIGDNGELISKTVNSNTIRYYVEPRLAVLVARVFVPGDLYSG